MKMTQEENYTLKKILKLVCVVFYISNKKKNSTFYFFYQLFKNDLYSQHYDLIILWVRNSGEMG